MSILHTASIASGSNGNCYYIANENEAVLVDAGISCRETEKRFLRLGLNIQKVKAIFISHEHTDHINGVEVLSKKYRLPVYISEATLRNSKLTIDPQLLRHFNAQQTIEAGELKINTFPKLHDAADPYSFTIEGNSVTVGVFTDIGKPCEHVTQRFAQCHAAFLETNYDEDMLMRGHYPYYLKQRISADTGHLSNAQALELFLNHRSPFLSHLFLSHLSRENNHPQKAEELFLQHSNGVTIIHASRLKETELFAISNSGNQASSAGASQLSIFS